MATIEIYSTATCHYCTRARRLLERKGVVYHDIRIDLDPSQRAVMIERSQRFTVPQIFINARSIGGYDDLAALEAQGLLDALLNSPWEHLE